MLPAVLTYLYLGALIFGGVLLGSSILLGGHEDLDGDLDGDLDVDGDADADGDLDKDIDVGGADFLFWLKSLRFYTFFLAFFGLTGLMLDGFGLVANSWVAFAIATAMGATVGVGATAAIRALSKEQSGENFTYVGKNAHVLVPVSKGSPGKIRVRVAGNLVDLLATTDEAEFGANDEALIIEMDGTRARIARVERE